MSDAVAKVRGLACWTGPVEPVALSGGLSNESFVVRDGGKSFVARLGGDLPVHHVSRQAEAAASRAAAKAGVSPRLVHVCAGAMVFDFIEAKTYGAPDVRANLGAVLKLVRRAHTQIPHHLRGRPPFFWVFHVIRDYAHQLADDGHAVTADLPRLVAQAAQLEKAQVPLPLVFGHHDLLPANFLDDGSRLWLIDWEYGGFGTPLFDLANLAANAALEPAAEHQLLTDYFGTPPGANLLRAFAAMKCASMLREAMWAMVSESHLSAPGVDYGAYGTENLGAFETGFAAYKTEFGG
ncbi:MAG: phosphotransferase [Alphaproteobacteria bacterium]